MGKPTREFVDLERAQKRLCLISIDALAGEVLGKQEIVENAQAVYEMEALRHISDSPTTPGIPYRLGHRVDFLSRNPHGSLNRPKQPCKNGEKRRLAGTGCAGDKPALIAIHAQIRNVQYRGRRIAVHQVFND
jgi:hypothetical protein